MGININREAYAWATYQFASNAFALTIVSTLLPIYFSEVAASPLSPNLATTIWAYVTSISLVVSAILSPIFGAVANMTASRKKYLIAFTSFGVFLTALLFFAARGKWIYTVLVFGFANLAYSLVDLFQNSLLPHIAEPDEIDRVSTRGYAFGYLGGGVLLAINIATIALMENKELALRLCFVSVSIWWTIFSIPLLLYVREPPYLDTGVKRGYPFTTGFQLLSQTFKEIKQYREVVIFLFAFWIYNDGIATIIKMATIYGADIGIDRNTLIWALLMTQFVGIPFAFAFGKLSQYWGAKNCIYLGLILYTFISIGGFLMTQAYQFWILAFLVGTVQGGTQALSRSLYGTMIPKAKTAEFYGFYGMSTRIGSFIGPFVFAVVSQTTGNSRYSVLSIVLFFVLGLVLLTQVDVEKGQKEAQF